MPTYGYRCNKCSTDFDVWQRMSDEAGAECPSCGGASTRQFFPAGIVFKGSGFYKTDSRGPGTSKGAPTSPATPDGEGAASKEAAPAGGDAAAKRDAAAAGTSADKASTTATPPPAPAPSSSTTKPSSGSSSSSAGPSAPKSSG